MYLLLVVLIYYPTQDLEGFLHGREAAVLIVTMVDTGVTIATDLYIEPSLLEVSYQW